MSIRSKGEELAKQLDIQLKHIRYVEYTHHTGQQWTITCRWEYLDGGQWVAVDWTLEN